MRESLLCFFLALFATCAVSAQDAGASMLRAGDPAPPVPLIIAHRGDSANAPENTLASFRSGMESGADIVEFDVHLSADGIPVIMHDAKVDRTTNGKGRLDRMTLAQLKALDAGSWFNPRFAGERIPTLGEALRLMKGRVRVLIEPKQVEPEISFSFSGASRGRAEELIQKCVNEVEAAGVQSEVLFHTFFPKNLKALEKLAPRYSYSFLFQFRAGRTLAMRYAKRHGASGFNSHLVNTIGSEVDLAHELDMRVFVYTVDTRAGFARALALKVDGIITNHPRELFTQLHPKPPAVTAKPAPLEVKLAE